MSISGRALGKVFLSHSSVDKPFVRRLAARIKKAGFTYWLDEHDLLPGDAIPERLAKAIDSCRVVLVVISKASLKSPWLNYELNIATQQMIEGRCRLIPVLKDEVEPPAAIKGLKYADFRKSPKKGTAEVVRVLESEAASAPLAFWAQIDNLLEEVFDFTGTESIGREYAIRDTEFVGLSGLDQAEDVYIGSEIVASYDDPPRPLNDTWWKEYRDAVSNANLDFFLIVTERPVAFMADVHLSDSGRIRAITPKFTVFDKETIVLVFVVLDLCGIESMDERRKLIVRSRAVLEDLIKQKTNLDREARAYLLATGKYVPTLTRRHTES